LGIELTWEERVYHPDANGVMRPLSGIWRKGKAPRSAAAVFALVQWMGNGLISGGLRIAWNDARQLHLAPGEQEALGPG
jgi:hypothetical protein